MTTAEACSLAVNLVRRLSAMGAERDSYRLLAVQAIHHIHALQAENAVIIERYHRLVDESRDLRRSLMAQEAA